MKGAKSTKKADSKLAVKKTAAKGKAAKDPNKPKRPASAFCVFMEELGKSSRQKTLTSNLLLLLAKLGGAKWKEMSDSEKAPYVAEADKRKKEYEKTLVAYNKKKAEGDDEDSDKSMSEVNDEELEEGSGKEANDDE